MNKVKPHFSTACILTLVASIIVAIFYGNHAMDIQLHDTYFVIGLSDIIFLYSLIFGFFALTYHLLQKLIGLEFNLSLGLIHFWIMTFSLILLLVSLGILNEATVPRRYYNFNGFDYLSQDNLKNKLFIFSLLLFFLSQFVFLVNFMVTFIKK